MELPGVVCTFNPIHVHEFEWILKNVTRLPVQLQGPAFFPIPNSSKSFYFHCVCTGWENAIRVNVHLMKGTETHTFNFICDVTLRNANDKILMNRNIQFQTGKQNCKQLVMELVLEKQPAELEFTDLPEDKLILKAKFLVSGYDIAPKELPSTIKNPPVSNSELLKNFKTMFECGHAHDVTFSVDGETIPAHTAVLCSRSQVFQKMFQHEMLEKSSKNIVIEDACFAVFKAFLLFLYTGEIEQQQDWVSLYSVADKYQVSSLRRECSRKLVRKLVDNMTVTSAFPFLKFADLHGDSELKEATTIFLRKNFAQVVETSEWAEIVDDNPRLASDVLRSIKSIPGAK